MRVTAQVLNVREGPGTKYPVVSQLRMGTDVDVIDEKDGWFRLAEPAGWVSKAYLVMSAVAPKGVLEIMQMFGAPAAPSCFAGRCMLPEPLKLGWEDKRINSFACHKQLEDVFTEVFHRIHSEGFWKDLKTFDGCFNDREMKGKARRSTHAWGIAVDLNAKENPLGDEDGAMSADVVRIFLEAGFMWGGHFVKRKDPMHFQFATGY